jgi:ATP phosphoribosyltransferase regulatory subunit
MPVRLCYEGSVAPPSPAGARLAAAAARAGRGRVRGLGHRPTPTLEVHHRHPRRAARQRRRRRSTVELSHAAFLTPLVDALPPSLREPVADAVTARDAATWRALLADHPDTVATLAALDDLAGPAAVLDAAEVHPGVSAAFAGPLKALRTLYAALADAVGADTLRFDLGELRGRGYYTGTFFQVLCPGAAEAVAAGGRYDDLLGRYGVALHATGAGIDLEAVEEALAAQGWRPTPSSARRVLVVGEGPARRREAARLRAAGCDVAELDPCAPEHARAYAEACGYSETITL